MFLDISYAKKQLGAQQFKTSFELDQITLAGLQAKPLGDCVIEGSCEFTDENRLELTGDCKVYLECLCSRCGNVFIFPYSFHINEFFSSNMETDDYPLSDQLDLSAVVNDMFLINFPAQLLCSKKCKGICSKCGQNLNENSCNCENEVSIDNPFSILKKLKK